MVLSRLVKKHSMLGEPGQTTNMEGVLPSPTGGPPLMSFSVSMVTSEDGKKANLRVGVTAPALTMARSRDEQLNPEAQGVKRLVDKATSIVRRTTGTLARRGSYTSLLQLELFAPEQVSEAQQLVASKKEKGQSLLEPAKQEQEQMELPMMSTPKVAFFYSEE